MAVRNPRVKTPAKKKVVVRKVGQVGKRKAQVKKPATRRKTPAKVASRGRQNPNVGSSFDNFLAEEGIKAQVQAEALKRVIAWHLQQAIEQQGLKKSHIAKQLNTSRAAVNRMLDPENTSMTLNSLGALADLLGKRLEIRLA